MNLFENLGLSRELFEVIERLGFTKPTQIQERSIPHIMKGRDVIGESETGSGKTLAFGSGIVDKVVPGKGVQALVLSPTRELAEQVKESIKQLSHGKHLRIMSVYGGVSINPQIHDLTNAEVVVATPGRLLDHLNRRTIDLSRVKILVLDEADRMLDMGFIDDVEKIIRVCPKQRQTMFFSATISYEIKRLADRYLNNPIEVLTNKYVDPSKLKQVYYDVSKNMKISVLVHLLREEDTDLVLVFCNTRRTTDFVVKNLRTNKVNAIAIHGGLSQNKRTSTLKSFNDAKAEVLVCTDVAARGLHIENVSHVYNYEIPKDSKDYVHRIGRTARAGESGKVINILCDLDHDNFGRIQRDYRNFEIENLDTPRVEQATTVRVESRGRSNNRGRPNTWRRSAPRRDGRPRGSGPRRDNEGPRRHDNQRRSDAPRRHDGQRRTDSPKRHDSSRRTDDGPKRDDGSKRSDSPKRNDSGPRKFHGPKRRYDNRRKGPRGNFRR
ncbi:DEAD/DEAH box helicase [Candidatus Woesearchaeota archaeon]|nr:DEAD/DEAH box helicase [Candidatus Woesearchaeota archaeon]